MRELENVVERILVHHSDAGMIDIEHLDNTAGARRAPSIMELTELEGLPMDEATARLERHLILRALERNGFVQSRTADALGTTRRILKYKMDQLGIHPSSNLKVND